VDDKKKQNFELNKVVYASSLEQYVTLKSFDQEKMSYKCRLVRKHDKDMKKYAEELKEEEQPTQDVEQDSLTEEMRFKVRIIRVDSRA
jgi:hypothetical protein